MEFKDYYKILGVERTADKKAISQAFRKLARQHHPDVNRGSKDAEARFKEINEAYQVLNDPERRGKYDQLLELRQRGGGWEEALRRGAAPGGDGTFTVFSEGMGPEGLGQFSDFFQQVFGNAFRPGGRRRGRDAGPDVEDVLRQQTRSSRTGRRAGGEDVEGTVEITLEEAYAGTVRTVTIPDDRGTPRSIEVKIPRGVRAGQRIRAAGQANGADLYLVVQILPHPGFTRDQDDLMCEVAVPVWTAALGGEIEVPTLGGRVMMTVPLGTRDGRTFRLRGQGMPHLRGGGAGDLLAKVRLTLPDPLTPRDRELLEEMRRLHEQPAAKS
ncbi:MAG TPA: DnaJ C-terminal domain-containing protein [bacterium]|nr:DnaJ C-terminal domain-containing protein [bacterium]